MPTYTVHAPPPRQGQSAPDPQRFVFVRDGFYFWAFVLAPLWLLVHRLWLAFAGYLALNFVVGGALVLLRVPTTAQVIVSLLIALLVGFEAASLWRWTLSRRRWAMLGFCVGDDLEAAEQRFFSAWSARAPDVRNSGAALPASEKFTAPVWRGTPAPSDVIGLFPEPGDRR
jgi:hypothetical protein